MTVERIALSELSADPHPVLAGLRSNEPVAWIDALGGWLVTSHEACVEVMLDPETFTVDDPRFSTQQVIGPSMLSLDGVEHRRHRDPFGGPFRASRVNELRDFTERLAGDLVANFVAAGSGDLRADVAAPLAVGVMAHVLDLGDVETSDLLSWYEQIVDAVHAVTAGEPVPDSGLRAFDELKAAVIGNRHTSSLLQPVDRESSLTIDEIASNIGVLLFGGIVTSESSSAIAFRYLLDEPDMCDRLQADPSLVRQFVEETFRLEPSASAVDRFATRDVSVGRSEMSAGDLVRVSLSAANRDPAVFDAPDEFRVDRSNAGKNVTFARGPHACLGIHLARLETVTAVSALLAGPKPVPSGPLYPIEGLVFRVPESVIVSFPEAGAAVR